MVPMVPAAAVKKSFPPDTVNRDSADDAGPGVMSATITGAATPERFQSSAP